MTRKASLSSSSGDLAADRRFLWAAAAEADGDHAAAADLYAQSAEAAPDWPPALYHLGKARQALGDGPGARQALERYLALEPADRLGAAIILAEAGDDAPALSHGYISALFDAYAGFFDDQLTGPLRYCGPDLLISALREAAGHDPRFESVLDLGCGTGLMAKALAGRAARVTGVDLSAEMLKRAAALGLYAELHAQELGAFLEAAPAAAYDLVIAADVFVYMAGLEQVFAGAARAARPGGLFAFSVQRGEGREITLGPDKRYWHSSAYLERLVGEHGFTRVILRDASTRLDNDVPVPCLIAVMRRAAL